MSNDIASLGRYPGLAAGALSEQQKAALDRLTGLRGSIPAPYRVWIESPGLVEQMAGLGAFLRKASLTQREFELVVLATAKGEDCAFVFEAHTRSGIRVGLDSSIPASIGAGRPPELHDRREQLVCEVATALNALARMPPDLAVRAEAELGHKMIVEVIALIGLYTAVCLTMKFYDVPPRRT